MPRTFIVATAIALASHAAFANAQGSGGSCCSSIAPHINAGIMTANDGSGPNEHQWIRAVVLWRTMQPTNSYRPESATVYRKMTEAARSAAEDAGHALLGSYDSAGPEYLEHSHDSRALFVLGQEFPVPQRDSALVVLVDRSGGAANNVIVGATYVPAEMPDSYFGKHWMSGDTSFTIMPKNQSNTLLERLRSSDVIRLFIDQAARP